MTTGRIRIGAAALACVAAGAVALPASAAALPKVLTQGLHKPFAVRPATISYTGDGTGVIGGPDGTGARHLGHLRWTRYNRHEGRAKGLDWIDNCRPDCAGGRFRPFPVDVHVFRPRHGRFTRLTLQYAYHGRKVVDRRGVRGDRVSGHTYWTYYIVDERTNGA